MKIKRHKNRKLYSYTLSKWVTMVELLQLYKTNQEMEIIDHEGNNITDRTLLSALFEVESMQGVSRDEINRRISILK